MQTFIRETAEQLYARYGDEVSSLHILFPSRRARLFFNDALAGIAGKPMWQPHYRSIDELMEEVAGIRRSDSIRLIAELYRVYSRYHTEPFDSFYYWGEMLLSDFDSIDKYRIDAAMLFINISDLKELESDLSYLTTEQIRIIRQFWRNFNVEDLSSPEKQHFVGVWNSLLPIYTDFRARLSEIGMAYPGMIYRQAADRMKEDMQAVDLSCGAPAPPQEPALQQLLARRYALAGFNALSESEKILFDYLRRHHVADFFWDYDSYYTDNPEQEAGLFLRENLSRFPSEPPRVKVSHFVQPKETVVVAAPSDVMQTKYVTDFLTRLIREGKTPGKETAIVLTDENLLLPLLYSIPKEVGKINITMGYPLRQTPAYALLERLIELQQHKKSKGDYTLFYHSHITGLLNHPLLQQAIGEPASRLAQEVLERQQIYLPAGKLGIDPLARRIFTPVDGWEALCEYLMGIISTLGTIASADETRKEMQPEFFTLIVDHIYKLQNSLRGCALEISDGVLLSLLRKILQTVRVPYEGEPLEGIQVMGILETRNLDFENVVVLSVNDDTFPGNLSVSSSFIPYNLRLAYGLPTPQHHEGVYGYYFYRLIQRAKRVHLVYSVKADDRKTGEPSRYIYQLDYESPHPVEMREMTLNVNFDTRQPIVIPKNEGIRRELHRFLAPEGDRKLSPSLFYSYVECPLKFYFQGIARLKEEEEISEEIDLPLFGNIFHKAAEIIYGDLKGTPDPDQRLKEMLNTPRIDKVVDRAIALEYFKDEKNTTPADFGGNITLIGDIVKKYLNTCLLAYDARMGAFEVQGVETGVETTIPVTIEGESRWVRLGGKIDRLDALDDDTLRVVDYKTGGRKSEFKGIDALFSPRYTDRNPAALQTLLYSLMLRRERSREIVPSLYYIRFMNAPDYSPLLTEIITDQAGKRCGSAEVGRFSEYAAPLQDRLTEKLAELFDRNLPFAPCEELKTCSYCPYREICNR